MSAQAGINLRPPADRLLVSGFAICVHPVEPEYLALAMEHPGSFMLLDYLAARSKLATSSHLFFTVTLACLAQTKRECCAP